MTEGSIDTAVVYERLRVIRELLKDLDGIGNVSATDLTTNRVQRHAVERIITQVVDLAVAINSHIAAAELGHGPATYRSSFERPPGQAPSLLTWQTGSLPAPAPGTYSRMSA